MHNKSIVNKGVDKPLTQRNKRYILDYGILYFLIEASSQRVLCLEILETFIKLYGYKCINN